MTSHCQCAKWFLSFKPSVEHKTSFNRDKQKITRLRPVRQRRDVVRADQSEEEEEQTTNIYRKWRRNTKKGFG